MSEIAIYRHFDQALRRFRFADDSGATQRTKKV
jgi:hypothetical protein